MKLRSLLFIPADSERKLARGDDAGADVIILDLEDSVAPARKDAARNLALEYLQARAADQRRCQVWVRINPLEAREAAEDLQQVMAGRPDGILQPKIRTPADVTELGQRLSRIEAHYGFGDGTTRILPLATETPQALFELGRFASPDRRLAGLSWGAEDLSAALGASTSIGPDGNWTAPYQLARSLCLFAAGAAGVPAIDTVHADFRNESSLRAACDTARRDGFSGKLAIHPGQVAVINEAFSPSAEEIEEAQAVVAAFAAQPDQGTIGLNGRMLDMPHLKQARRILEQAGLQPVA